MGKIGLCLTGGGARGSYQIGAMEALRDLGIFQDIEAYAGTSIGAANCAVLATRGIEAAKRVWLEMPSENIPRLEKETSNNKLRFRPLEEGIYSMHIFENTIKEAIDMDKIREKEVYVTVSEAGDSDKGLLEVMRVRMAHTMHKGNFVHYVPLKSLENDELIIKTVIASCSIPIFFAPVEYEGKKYYDGGMYDNHPVKPLVEAGCDEIIIVHLHNKRGFTLKGLPSDVTYHQIQHKGKGYGKILKFSKAQSERLIELGYNETMAYFKSLKENVNENSHNQNSAKDVDDRNNRST